MGLPDQGLCFGLLGTAHAPVQALAGKGRELDFGHVQPGAVVGGEVKMALVAQLPGPFDGQVLVESAVGVGAVVILHQLDGGHVRVMGGDHPVHKPGVIGLRLGGCDVQMALAGSML